ncbi:MAG: hypothetical protein WA191_00080, partial [Telluria sp.]
VGQRQCQHDFFIGSFLVQCRVHLSGHPGVLIDFQIVIRIILINNQFISYMQKWGNLPALLVGELLAPEDPGGPAWRLTQHRRWP